MRLYTHACSEESGVKTGRRDGKEHHIELKMNHLQVQKQVKCICIKMRDPKGVPAKQLKNSR